MLNRLGLILLEYACLCLTVFGIVLAIPKNNVSAWTHGSIVTPYSGISSTRGYVDTGQNTNFQYLMSRSVHYARSNLSNIRLLLTNWFMQQPSNVTETGTGGTSTETVGIEYPFGTCAAVKFGGVTSFSISSLTTILTDDLTGLSIPTGAAFAVRQWVHNNSGIYYFVGIEDQTIGDSMAVSSSALPDQTTSCTAISDSAVGIHTPLAIISTITQPSVAIIGDSIAGGIGDSYTAGSGDLGFIARAVGPNFGYSNVAVPGDAASFWVNNGSTQRASILPYVSNMIVEYGSNDFIGETLSQVKTYLSTIYAQAPAGVAQTFQTTISPRTSSTDNWQTPIPPYTGTNNQTAQSWEASRQSLNSSLVAKTYGPNGGAFDTAAVVTALPSAPSAWIANGTSKWCTADGIHPSVLCHSTIATSGAIPSLAFKP
jgi:hypothetical protein